MTFPTHPASAICVRALTKTFTLHHQGGVTLQAIEQVDLDVDSGEAVALVGPSGAGKSTLMRCLYGNYSPDSGSIVVNHHNGAVEMVDASPRTILAVRRHTVAYVSQFLRVIPRVPTIDIVTEPAIERGMTVDEARDRAVELLRTLAIPERMWTLAPSTFSGGEQQRVNVARGLAGGHPILLVDEPTASLDRDNREAVVRLLKYRLAAGAAIVGIFHDEATRDAVSTRTYDLRQRAGLAVGS